MSRTNRISGIADDGDTDEHLRQLVGVREKRFEPIAPDEAIERYFEDEKRKCRRATVDLHRPKTGSLVDRYPDLERDDANNYEIEQYDDLRLGANYSISKLIPDVADDSI